MTVRAAMPPEPPTYPNKRHRLLEPGPGSTISPGGGSGGSVIAATFTFNSEKSPLDVRCFPITNQDSLVGSFSLKFPLLASDWGTAAKENLTLSLDKRENGIVLALRDQNGRKIGHFEDFGDNYQGFMKLFFDLNDDLSAEALISFPHPFFVAEIKIGLPQDTIQKYLSSYQQHENLAFFLLNLRCGSRLGQLAKVIVPANRSPSLDRALQPLLLTSKLLDFQKETVGWMLEREGTMVTLIEKEDVATEKVSVLSVESVDIPPTRSLIELIPGFFFDVSSNFYTNNPDAGQYEVIHGGILCDEMGMGKTLMVLSVVLLNRCRDIQVTPFAGELTPAKTTLIIVPPSILNQWTLETEKNTPSLKFYIFEGGKSLDKDQNPVTGSQLAKYDIVFTTYSTLQKEIHAASSGRGGARRGQREVRRRNSPLMELLWYRVVLDEAQMVENTVSNASAMACKIPRFISWTVTGTPCPKTGTLEDMKGLFLFANSELYTWSSIFKLPDLALATILSPVLHRDSKDHCKDELVLPKQEDQTFYIPFTKVEEQYYDDFVHEAVEAIGPFPEVPDLTGLEYEKARGVMKSHEEHKNIRFGLMAKWFLRLRQTCCHPKASLEGRRLLGGRARTMEEVRDTMLHRCNSIIHGGQRALVGNAIERGQILVILKEYEEAIELYKAELPKCQEKRKSLEEELMAVMESRENEESSGAISDEGENTVTRLKRDIRNWNEVEHRVLYFIAIAYADLNDETNEFHYYELATDVRESMLAELQDSYQFYRKQAIATCNANLVDFQRELLIPVDMHGGIMTNKIFTELEPIEDMLMDQWDFIRSWRDMIKESLISATGSDFENGLKVDEIAGIFVEMLGVLLLFRKELLTAEAKNHPFCDSCGEAILKGKLTECAHMFCSSCCKELKPNKAGTCPCPLCHEKIVVEDMDDIVSSMKPRVDPELAPGPQTDLYNKIKNLQLEPKSDSYKSILGKFKAVLSRYDLPQGERDLARQASRHMAKHMEIQLRHVHTLEKEIATFKNLQNARAAYYRLLKKIEVSVTPSTWSKPVDEVLPTLIKSAQDWNSRIEAEEKKKKFLLNRATNQEESKAKTCKICRNQMLTGYTFPCGHYSCSDCFMKWNAKQQKCHMCNIPMDHNACHKTNELPSLRPIPAPTTIASELQAKVSSVKINESVGSKMNMVTKHITLLLKEDPSVKILCFSQWDTVLKMFAESLIKQKIGYITLEGSGWDKGTEKEIRQGKKGLAVSTFVDNPNVSCFLLHAKSQSAGLSLVAATHVFLLEPMIHKGLEDQAIGRIHRIGQTKPTFVWRYIIQATDRQVKIKKRDEGKTVAQSQLLNFFEPMIIEKNNHLRLLTKEFEENDM